MSRTPVRRALVSVFDKSGVADFAKSLADLGVDIVSTGSTAGVIADAGVPVTAVSEVTGFPECLDGRVKTLHPKMHAGILADRSKPDHMRQLDELDVTPIDLVAVNLYPFMDTVRSGASDAEIVEMIDIGGPTMVRSAAKNHAAVAVIVSPADYDVVIEELREHGGLSDETRTRLATDAFKHTAAYDTAVAAWFQRDSDNPGRFPDQLGFAVEKRQVLRYGENPHQDAVWYGHVEAGLGAVQQLHGKELSYNNLIDTDAAWGMAIDHERPCIAIIKHTNPAGYACADDLATAYDKALSGDPVSAFGGIVASNRTIDLATAERISKVFTEVVIAPGYDDDALALLQAKKNLRILLMPDTEIRGGWTFRSISGGLLVQTEDVGEEPFDEWRVVTDAQPDERMLADLRFAWTAAKHTKSNAIVFATDEHVVGVGAGQMSRVDSVRLAVEKSGDRHVGAVLASDAFFPFRDGPDAAAAAGIVAMVQPGGSVRDDEVIAAANEHGLVMVFTGRRHFRH